jgi:hypothetical protein
VEEPLLIGDEVFDVLVKRAVVHRVSVPVRESHDSAGCRRSRARV